MLRHERSQDVLAQATLLAGAIAGLGAIVVSLAYYGVDGRGAFALAAALGIGLSEIADMGIGVALSRVLSVQDGHLAAFQHKRFGAMIAVAIVLMAPGAAIAASLLGQVGIETVPLALAAFGQSGGRLLAGWAASLARGRTTGVRVVAPLAGPSVASLLGVAGAGHVGMPLESALVVTGLVVLVSAVPFLVFEYREIPRAESAEGVLPFGPTWRSLGLPSYAGGVGAVVWTRMDILILSQIADLSLVGHYSVVKSLTDGLTLLGVSPASTAFTHGARSMPEARLLASSWILRYALIAGAPLGLLAVALYGRATMWPNSMYVISPLLFMAAISFINFRHSFMFFLGTGRAHVRSRGTVLAVLICVLGFSLAIVIRSPIVLAATTALALASAWLVASKLSTRIRAA